VTGLKQIKVQLQNVDVICRRLEVKQYCLGYNMTKWQQLAYDVCVSACSKFKVQLHCL